MPLKHEEVRRQKGPYSLKSEISKHTQMILLGEWPLEARGLRFLALKNYKILTSRYITECSDTPSTPVRFEYLKWDSDWILSHSVQTCIVTFAKLIAFIDSSRDSLHESSKFITCICIYLGIRIAGCSGLNCQLPTRTFFFILKLRNIK